jgi:hypothetical protein
MLSYAMHDPLEKLHRQCSRIKALDRRARRLFRRAGQASTPNEQERLLEEVNLLLDERDQLQAQVEDEQQAFMRDFCLGVRAHVNFLEAMKEKP